MSRSVTPRRRAQGPWYAEQVRDGDYCEVSRGHLILQSPAGRKHARPHGVGALSLTSDPAVRDAGIDVGHALDAKTLRAPDISIGDLGDGDGTWSNVAPPLAVEYVSFGQDEADLREKIKEMLQAGTRWVWVVRLTGARRVEVYQKGQPVQIKRPGERLAAPGVLKNSPLVEALYDPAASFEQALQNLLERKGYASLDAVRDEGKALGRAEGEAKGKARGVAETLLTMLEARGLKVTAAQRARVLGCPDLALLDAWVLRALTINKTSDLFAAPRRVAKTRR